MKVCVPPEMMTPPVPEITPSKLSTAFVMESVLAPRFTEPLEAPARLRMEAPLVPEISKVPSALTEAEAAMLPAPVRARVAPDAICVLPVYVFTPIRVCVPPSILTPPSPEMTPSNVSLALVISSVLAPRTTLTPASPLSVVIRDELAVTPEISKIVVLCRSTCLEVAMEPSPLSASVPPMTVVVPV